ncbi:MAG: HD domain-containing protein [Bacteroidota bacterium]
MDYFSIDYLIVYGILIFTLGLGIHAGRGIKDIREYAIANKMYGTVTLTLTFLATNIGGSRVLDTASRMLSDGIISSVAAAGIIIQILFIGIFITPKIVRFTDCITMGDVMGALYGKTSRVITGILGTLYSTCMMGMQLLALGIIGEAFLDIQPGTSIMVSGLILTIYSAYGGIKSVTITDVFQFIVLVVVLPLITSTALKHAGGVKEVLTSLAPEKCQIFGHEKFSYYLTLFLVWSIFPVGITSSAIFQRLLMAKEPHQLRRQYFVIAAFDPTFSLMIALLGLAGLHLYPHVEARSIVPTIIQELLPVGAKGLAISGLLAVVMSTADSYLHAAGLLLTHDVFKPLCDRYNLSIDELKWAKYTILIIGIGAIGIALRSTSLLGLSFAAVRFTGPLLMFPLIVGILGLKCDKSTFYIASVITLVVFALTTWGLPKGHSHLAVPISIVANGVSLLGAHIMRYGGLAVVSHKEQSTTLWQPQRGSFTMFLRQLLPTPRRIVQYSQTKVEQYKAPYELFGTFLVINYVLPYFMWSHDSPAIYDLMFTLRLVGGILCSLLIVQEKWPQALRPYLPVYWHATILYCLPFMSSLMFLVTKGSTEWLINAAIITILLFVVVDWLSALFIGFGGLIMGCAYYRYLLGGLQLPLDFSTRYLLLYQLVFGVLIGLLFARRKQFSFHKLTTQRDYLEQVQSATSSRLAESLNYQKELLKEFTGDAVAIFDEATAAYLRQAIYRITDYLRLDIDKVSLDTLFENVVDVLRAQDLLPQIQLLIQKHTQVEEIHADASKLKQVLINGVTYLQKHSPGVRDIKIGLEDAVLGHNISYMPDYTRKLQALKLTITTAKELPATQEMYMIEPSQSSSWISDKRGDLSLVDNACIIDAHYGYVSVDPTTLVYVIPVNVRTLRGQAMELLNVPAQIDPEAINHPLSIQLEKTFFSRLKDTKIDMAVISQAVHTIKKYHGGTKRKSGEPFFTHPLAVALIVLDHSEDQEAVLAALLHDSVEDTGLSLEQIRAGFGEKIAFLVAQLSDLDGKLRRIKLEGHANLYRLLSAEDPRVGLVKLSDRLHNMRTLQGHPSLSKRKRIAEETLTFFVPMAIRLQHMGLAKELQKLSLAVLEP